MADSPSKDKYTEAIDFISSFLREHERHLDEAIDGFANIMERLKTAEELDKKLTALDNSIDALQKQLQDLSSRMKYVKK